MKIAVLALLLTGCNAIFGLDPTGLGRDGAVTDGAIDGTPDGAGRCLPVGHDEDLDTVDDACDDCPHVADLTQVDTDLDGVGDACDPHPGPADQIVLFEPFSTGADDTWTPVRGNWTADAAGLHESDAASASTLAFLDAAVPGGATFDVGVRIDTVNGLGPHAFAVWVDATWTGLQTQPDGYAVGIFHPANSAPQVNASAWQGDFQSVLGVSQITATYLAGDRYRIRTTREPAVLDVAGYYLPTGTSAGTTANDARYQTGQLGFTCAQTAITVEYVVVIAPQ